MLPNPVVAASSITFKAWWCLPTASWPRTQPVSIAPFPPPREIISDGYNPINDGSCYLTASTDRPSMDPLLGLLRDNGGLTFTHAVLPGSPAIGGIPWDANGCSTTFISD